MKCCASAKWGVGTRWRPATRQPRIRQRCATEAALRRFRALNSRSRRPVPQEGHLVPLIQRWASTLGVSILDKPLAGRIAVIADSADESESLALALLLVLASPSVRAKIAGVLATGTPASEEPSNQDDAASAGSSRPAKTDRYGFFFHERCARRLRGRAPAYRHARHSLDGGLPRRRRTVRSPLPLPSETNVVRVETQAEKRQRLQLENLRAEKWRGMCNNWERWVAAPPPRQGPPSQAPHARARWRKHKADKVKKRIRKGIPDSIRGFVWPRLVHALEMDVESAWRRVVAMDRGASGALTRRPAPAQSRTPTTWRRRGSIRTRRPSPGA